MHSLEYCINWYIFSPLLGSASLLHRNRKLHSCEASVISYVIMCCSKKTLVIYSLDGSTDIWSLKTESVASFFQVRWNRCVKHNNQTIIYLVNSNQTNNFLVKESSSLLSSKSEE